MTTTLIGTPGSGYRTACAHCPEAQRLRSILRSRDEEILVLKQLLVETDEDLSRIKNRLGFPARQ